VSAPASLSIVEAGPSTGPVVLLLHGMLGETDNWDAAMPALARAGYRAVAPRLPVYTAPLPDTSVEGLARLVLALLDRLAQPAVLVGNSLGGHVAALVAHARPADVPALVLSGASGMGEVSLGTSMPRRHDRAFIADRTAFTFHDPVHATDTLVDRMMGVIADREQVTRLVRMSRSASGTPLEDVLPRLPMPTLLVWGRDDRITPPEIAEAFAERLPDARIAWVEACGHAPMIEHPAAFNAALLAFLAEVVPAGGQPA
jgi:2-hydroxy-6-oxonona-2,4-dienedioate hydrolase